MFVSVGPGELSLSVGAVPLQSLQQVPGGVWPSSKAFIPVGIHHQVFQHDPGVYNREEVCEMWLRRIWFLSIGVSWLHKDL